MQSTLFRQNKPFSIAYVYKSKKDGATPTLAQLLTKLYDGLFLSKFYFFLVFTLSRDNNGKRRHKIFFSMFLVHCNLQWRREKKIQRHPKVKTKYFEKWIILIMSTTLFSRRIKRSPLWKKKIITFGDSAKKTAVDLVFFFFGALQKHYPILCTFIYSHVILSPIRFFIFFFFKLSSHWMSNENICHEDLYEYIFSGKPAKKVHL